MGNSFVAGAKCYMPFKRELGGHGVPPAPANENLYWEKTTEDELGSGWIVREKVKSWEPDEKYETLRKQYSDAMIAAESAKDEIRILKQENTALNNNFNTVVKENDKLRKENEELQNEVNLIGEENHKMHRDFDEMRQGGLEQNRKLQESADKFRNLYHEEKKLKDYYQKELGEVCEINKTLNESLVELQREETDEECVMAEQSPEAKAYEDMHIKRMALENEKLELENLERKRNLGIKSEDEKDETIKRYFEQIQKHQYEIRDLKRAQHEYPESVWEVLSDRTRKLKDSITLRSRVIWVAIVAFGVNEVIQWLTR